MKKVAPANFAILETAVEMPAINMALTETNPRITVPRLRLVDRSKIAGTGLSFYGPIASIDREEKEP